MGEMIDGGRHCPICGGMPHGDAFPYETRFNHCDYVYLKCATCATVFVDPVPDVAAFKLMYSKSEYHDIHYEGVEQTAYFESVEFLSRHLQAGKSILDYGCGAGYFLIACAAHGYTAIGVEFDADEIRSAGERSGCATFSVDAFEGIRQNERFDAIHFGDVLEHLPDPFGTLASLVDQLPSGGIVYVEGPLEVNASPVYWFSLLFGKVKKLLRPYSIGNYPPTHLLRTDAASQYQFLKRLGEGFEIVDWKIEETGWPYAGGGLVKSAIAGIAKAIGGGRLFGMVFGNRFKAVLVKVRAMQVRDETDADAIIRQS